MTELSFSDEMRIYFSNQIEISTSTNIKYKFYCFEGKGVTTGKQISIINVNNVQTPVIQQLGNKERKLSLKISFLGFDAPRTSTDNARNAKYVYNSYIEQKQFLETIRETKEKVTIKLTDGEICENCFVENCSVDMEKINKTTYNIDFIVLGRRKNIIKVSMDKQKFRDAMNKSWNSFLTKINNNSLIKKITKGLNVFKYYSDKATSYVNEFTDMVNDIGSMVNNAKNSVLAIINKPMLLAKKINGLIATAGKVVTSPVLMAQEIKNSIDLAVNEFLKIDDSFRSAIDMITNAYIHGDTGTTYKTSEPTSFNLITESSQSFSNILTVSKNLAVTLSFADLITKVPLTDDVIVLELKQKFNDMFQGLNTVSDTLLPFESKQSLIEIKKQLDTYLNDALTTTLKIRTYTVKKPDNIMNIVQEIYGNLDNLYLIIKLNEFIIIDITYVYGDIKIYE